MYDHFWLCPHLHLSPEKLNAHGHDLGARNASERWINSWITHLSEGQNWPQVHKSGVLTLGPFGDFLCWMIFLAQLPVLEHSILGHVSFGGIAYSLTNHFLHVRCWRIPLWEPTAEPSGTPNHWRLCSSKKKRLLGSQSGTQQDSAPRWNVTFMESEELGQLVDVFQPFPWEPIF